jgi:hypothetical protein
METSQNENVMIIDGENEIHLNEWHMQDQIMNGNFQIKKNTIEEITNPNENNAMEEPFKHCILKRRIGNDIIGMQFVGLFIM